jgi:hypothetical protein
MRSTAWVASVLLLIPACGDRETEDRRGYTKAPLETPGLIVDAEARTDMNALGTPNRPVGETIPGTVVDSAEAGG